MTWRIRGLATFCRRWLCNPASGQPTLAAASDLFEHLAPDNLAFNGQSAPLLVVQQNALWAKVLFQALILNRSRLLPMIIQNSCQA